MKAEEIITQLHAFLPKFTNKFSSNFDIATITSSGLTATATTTAAHGLLINNVVNIIGTESPVDIDTVTRAGTIATIETLNDHDLTEGVFPTVTIGGTSEAIFNGTFTLRTVPNRREFTILVADSGAATATGGNLTSPGSKGGYDGLVTVLSVPTTTSFTYTLVFAQPNDAIPGIGQVRQGIRITGAANHDRAETMYTATSGSDLWGFVILEDVFASKDRHGSNDAVSSAGISGSRRQQIIQPFIFEIFIPTSGDLSGRSARDDAEELSASVYKSLVSFKASSLLSSSGGTGIFFLESGIVEYNTSWMAYSWRFQLLANIENADTIEHSFDVAFRDISLSIDTNLGTETLIASLDLDDEPIP